MTIAAATDPAVTVTMVVHDVGTANYSTDNAAGDRADGSCYDSSRAGTDGDAFERSGLGREGHCRQHRNQQSGLEDRAHEKLLG
jgi:hypothetical protein